MARTAVFLLFALGLAACHSAGQRSDNSQPVLSGGDGLTLEHAVVMTGGNEVTNTAAEYAWIHQHVPEGKVTGQALIDRDRRVYDKLDVALLDGSSRSYYFDITSGFGKLF